jgi:hypothetical protein
MPFSVRFGELPGASLESFPAKLTQTSGLELLSRLELSNELYDPTVAAF